MPTIEKTAKILRTLEALQHCGYGRDHAPEDAELVRVEVEREPWDTRQSSGIYLVDIETDRDGFRCLTLVPVDPSGGGLAKSTERRDSYGYQNGGDLYRAAVDMAKGLAEARGIA